MKQYKLIFSTLLAIILLATQIIAVGAAPVNQETETEFITGTVESITLETNPETEEITVLVTITDENGETQTVTLSLETATGLGLVVDDGTGTPVASDEAVGSEISLDPTTILAGEEEKEHPVGSKLGEFFSDTLGVDYDAVMSYHDDGAGFGVIAQALWMTHSLDGDTTTFSAILDAKQSKDFSAITLPDGSTPTNWGQFRKAVMSDREKSKENLGAIMSGHADNGEDETGEITDEQEETVSVDKANNGKAPDKENKDKNNNGKKDKNKDNGKGKGNSKNK